MLHGSQRPSNPPLITVSTSYEDAHSWYAIVIVQSSIIFYWAPVCVYVCMMQRNAMQCNTMRTQKAFRTPQEYTHAGI